MSKKSTLKINKNKETRCTPTNFAFTFEYISTVIDDILKGWLNHYNNTSARGNIQSQAIKSLAANINSAAAKLARESTSVVCKLGEISISNHRNTQCRKPSETLSLMLGKKVRVTIRDTHQQLMYKRERNFGANPSYWRGNVSNIPLTGVISQTSQKQRNILRKGLKGFTSHINVQVTIFAIEEAPISFRNWSL